MSDHSFNPFIAKKYGINVAILISSFVFWTRTNAAAEKNYHDGRYWSFGTPEYFLRYFPYFTEKQIKYALQKAVSSGALMQGNFNKKGYDKTSWFALTDQVLSELNLDITCLKPLLGLTGQNCPMDRTKLSYGRDKIVLPIPDTKPSTKPDINIYTQTTESAQNKSNKIKPVEYQETYYDEVTIKTEDSSEPPKATLSKSSATMLSNENPHKIDDDAFQSWLQIRKTKKAPVTARVWALLNKELSKCESPIEAFDLMILRGWTTVKYEWVMNDRSQRINNQQETRQQRSERNLKSLDWINPGR